MKQQLLIVDDDQGIRFELSRFLSQHGYTVHEAQNGQQMRKQLAQQQMDLIILDVMMPGEDGMTLCRELRVKSAVPIIMLTAVQEEIERILGLEMGADDYLNKPFNPRELLARIKAVLRRTHGKRDIENHQQAAALEQQLAYRFSGWLLEKATRRLISPDELEISLSGGEYNLLLAFVERPQQVLSRDQLLDLTRNRQANPFDRSIDIQVSRLRHKIETDHKKPSLIKTVRGGGYVFSTTVERVSL